MSDRAASPEPGAPASPGHLRGTRASVARSAASPSQPRDIASPESVRAIAAMPAMERIKAEHAAKLGRVQAHATARRRGTGGGFGSSANLTAAGSARSEQQRRKNERDAAIEQERREALQCAKHGGPTDPRSVKHKDASVWARSAASSNRHGFQRPWPSKVFPSPVPQQSMANAAPGPGAYGESRSHMK